MLKLTQFYKFYNGIHDYSNARFTRVLSENPVGVLVLVTILLIIWNYRKMKLLLSHSGSLMNILALCCGMHYLMR